MNNGRMWLHIKPSVGLPLFFGGVALTSMTVHYALLTHTTWVPAFLNGSKAKVAAVGPVTPGAAPAAGLSKPDGWAPGVGSARATPEPGTVRALPEKRSGLDL
jgi:light-harvesting protein B-800-850 alpha chain